MSDTSSEEQTGEAMRDYALRQPPSEDVADARRNRRLQRKHPVEEGKNSYLAGAKPCPTCGTPSDA